jgi:hypothetical protein
MTEIDTSTEAIAAMAPYWAGHPCYELAQALAAERDAAIADREALRPLSLQCDRLAAEVAKLREALENIAEYWNGGDGDAAVDAAEECRARALAALAGDTP